ncbi:hypothetical protein KW798_02810 [Candidatus Parcubacteria bacterium]|nr:hypothetical protein [Candidatus Parcubacteria bacterium]
MLKKPQQGSLEVIAGLVIIGGIISALVLWSVFLRATPSLDLVTGTSTTTADTDLGTAIEADVASSSVQGILPYKSGITGTVMMGPTCPGPAKQDDTNCADKPLATLVAIYRASDPVHAVVLMDTEKNGEFNASLPPGDYIVGAGESELPRCAAENVTVLPNVYAEVTIQCDTGLR